MKRRIVHTEIPTTNAKASAKFYSDLFGWSIQRDEEMDYTMFEAGNLGGGFAPLSEHIKVGDIIVYIESDDIDADLKHIEAAGGKIVTPKMAIGNFGFLANFTDPDGNVLALWQDVSMQNQQS